MVIFLDFDGVLCTGRQAMAIGERGVISCLDPVALAFLDRMCRDHGTQIVISSTWRIGDDHLGFRRLFCAGGHHHMADAIHDDWATPVTAGTRGEEIQVWLDQHPGTEYLILDDDSDMLEHQLPHFIQTDSHNGMLYEHYRRVEAAIEPGPQSGTRGAGV